MSNRPGALGNIAWLTAERVARLLLQLFIAVVVIRYLGPSKFGIVATVASIALILVGIQNFGFDSLVMDATDEDPPRDNRVLVTALSTRAALGLLFAVGLGVGAQFVGNDEIRFGLMVTIAVVVAMPLDTFRMALDVRRQSRVYVRRRIAVIALHVVIQVTLVLLETEVVLFLAANAFIAVMQYVVVAYPLPRVAWVGGFDFGVLRRALPLFFAAVAANLYLRIDTVMLTGLYGPTEAGIYSAAVQIAEIPGFLPIAIGATFFLDIRTAKGNPTQEQDVLTYTTALVTGTVGLAVIGLIVFGPFLLPLLLGEAFQESAKILVIYAPSMFFLGWGIIRHRWLVVNNLEYHSAIAAIIGLVVNVGLNLALIPSLGAVGATIATLVSYAMGMYGYSVVVPRCRPAAVAVHRSFARAPRAVLKLLKRDRTSVD